MVLSKSELSEAVFPNEVEKANLVFNGSSIDGLARPLLLEFLHASKIIKHFLLICSKYKTSSEILTPLSSILFFSL